MNNRFFILRRQITKRRKAAVNLVFHLRRQTAKAPKAAVNPSVFSSTYWRHSRNAVFLYRIGLPLFVSYTKLLHSGISQILGLPKKRKGLFRLCHCKKTLKFQGIPEAVPKRTQRDRQFCALALVLTYKKYGSLY